MREAGDEDEPREKFALLIERQAERKEDETFHGIVESVFGLPLSHSDGSVESLRMALPVRDPRAGSGEGAGDRKRPGSGWERSAPRGEVGVLTPRGPLGHEVERLLLRLGARRAPRGS